MADYRLAVDVGGTFTDVFVFDEIKKEIFVTKVSSTPKEPEKGIIEGVKRQDYLGKILCNFHMGRQ